MALKIWENQCDTVIAEDIADVRAVLNEQHGREEPFDADEWEVETDLSRTLAIHDFDGKGTTVSRTLAEWITTAGRGFLCTTEF